MTASHQEMMQAKFSNKIDWKLLREQKEVLLEMVNTPPDITEEESEALYGIIHLIDDIQDNAVKVYGVPEREVYGRKPQHGTEPGDRKEFIHGMLYAIQELVSLGHYGQAEEIIRNSNIPRDHIEECQEESGYLTEEVTDILDVVFD